MIYVVKRDGRIMPFNLEKIKTAILKAFQAVDHEITPYAEIKAENIANYIEGFCEDIEEPQSIEEIQDLVENGLMSTKRKDVAKAYIKYREERSKQRNWNNMMMQAAKDKLSAKKIDNQNANVDENSFGGRKGEFDSVIMKQFALDNCMSKTSKEHHLNNIIYIHDLDSYAVGMHNCTVRTTKFLTEYGVYSFEDFSDGDIIKVLTHTGKIQKATVKSYGIQNINKITFSRTGTEISEKFTPNHRWILQDGTITENLKVGDKIYKAPINIREFNFDAATEKEQYYWCLGFVLGDGTEAYRWSHGIKKEDIKFVRLRLCGEKIKYESRFKNLKHSVKKLENGDLYLTFSSVIGFRKIFPDLSNMTRQQQLALFDGLYCADGQKKGSRKSITTTDEQIASFIEDVIPSLGYYIINIKDKTGEITNYKKRDFTKEFTFIGDTNKYYWTVTKIEPSIPEEVWCLDVNQDHSFILPNGLVTGNCLSIPFDDLLAKGFNTRQTDVRPANSISTAFQLVAVLFQIQSLQQFGGVSATHLDWTMVPYVRKSFYKHYIDGLKYISKKEEMTIPVGIGDKTFKLNELPKETLSKTDINDTYIYNNKEAYQYARDMTIKELNQAVEGMYHNLK